MMALLQSEQFWITFAAIAPLIAGIFSAVADLIARSERKASENGRHGWANAAAFAHYVVEAFNRGPKSWRGFLLALAAGLTILLQGGQ